MKAFGPIGRGLKWVCTLVGLSLLLSWVQFGNGAVLIFGVTFFTVGCVLRATESGE